MVERWTPEQLVAAMIEWRAEDGKPRNPLDLPPKSKED